MRIVWYIMGALALVSLFFVLWDKFRYTGEETEVDKDDERFGKSI